MEPCEALESRSVSRPTRPPSPTTVRGGEGDGSPDVAVLDLTPPDELGVAVQTLTSPEDLGFVVQGLAPLELEGGGAEVQKMTRHRGLGLKPRAGQSVGMFGMTPNERFEVEMLRLLLSEERSITYWDKRYLNSLTS